MQEITVKARVSQFVNYDLNGFENICAKIHVYKIVDNKEIPLDENGKGIIYLKAQKHDDASIYQSLYEAISTVCEEVSERIENGYADTDNKYPKEDE